MSGRQLELCATLLLPVGDLFFSNLMVIGIIKNRILKKNIVDNFRFWAISGFGQMPVFIILSPFLVYDMTSNPSFYQVFLLNHIQVM